MSNPHILSWTNPTQDTQGNPYTQAENTGYEVVFDGGTPVTLPGVTWATSFDLSTLPAYQALKAGTHTVELAAIDAGGASAFTAAVTFSIVATPLAPTNLAIT
jgi:hypothetical protein